MSAEIHIADVKTVFQVTVKDEDDQAMDLSTATRKLIVFGKPSGAVLSKEASFTNDGADGIIQCVSASGDIDEVGYWKIQAIVDVDGGTWHNNVQKFRVYPNIRD